MTDNAETWTVIKFLRDHKLPRFPMFEGETWTTYRPVGDLFELGAGQLERGRDFEVLYMGDRHGTRAHEAKTSIRRCEHHACRGCDICGGAYARPSTT